MELLKNLVTSAQKVVFEEKQDKNIVSILAVKITEKDTIQKSPLCQLPADVLQAIIMRMKASSLPRNEDGLGAVTLTELTLRKKAILSLMSTCYNIYSKTRHLFINNAEKYLTSLSGVYESTDNSTHRSSSYYAQKGPYFPYVYMTDLDTTQNKVTGVFKLQNAFQQDARTETPTFKISHFDVEPIFSVPLAFHLATLTNNPRFYDLNEAYLVGAFTNAPMYESTENISQSPFPQISVSSLFQFTGLLIRFCVSAEEWKKIDKDLKTSILEREKLILESHCGPYSMAKEASKNSPFCVFTQVVTFPTNFLLPQGREKLSSNLLLDFKSYKERKGDRIPRAEEDIENNIDYDLPVVNAEIPISGIDSKPPFQLFGREKFYPKGSFNKNFEEEVNNLPNCSLFIRRMMKCGVGVTAIIDDQDCCYGEVKKLVDKICFSSDDVLKETITRVVSKECLEPPGMSEEQLSSRILSIYNNLL